MILAASPRPGNPLLLSDPVFRWSARKLPPAATFRLTVHPWQPDQPLAKAAQGRPAYAVSDLRHNVHRIPASERKLAPGRTYCWKVATKLPNGTIIESAAMGFRYEARKAAKGPERCVADISDRFDPALHLPPAPFVWGHPVVWRSRASLATGGGGASDPGGTTAPGWKWAIWGDEAARIHLIEPYWHEARLAWDYSDVEGCDEVLLQIAGPDGFAQPNSTEARDDPGVAAWYSGPVVVPDECLGTFLYFQGDTRRETSAHLVNLQYTGSDHDFWDSLAVRLVPLRADGSQADVASDHVSVGCVDLPLITLETCSVDWTWGETPNRRTTFTLRLGREFPTGGDGGRATLAIGGWTPHTGRSIANAVLTNEGLLDDDLVGTGTTGTWRGRPAYFDLIPEWTDGLRLSYTLDQTPSAATASTGLLGHLLHFTDLHLVLHCVPGLTPDTYTCGRRLRDDGVPEIPCGAAYEGHFYDATLRSSDLFDGHQESGLEPLHRLFTRPLTGTRHSLRTVDGVTEESESDVTVEFRYVEEFEDAGEWESYLMRSTALGSPSTITMVESSGGTTTEYDFRMMGFHAMMARTSRPFAWIGGPGTAPGRLVFDPPALRMHFEEDRSEWDDEAGRWVSDVDTITYSLRH